GSGEGAVYLWVIDPLDGTTNFIHGVPHFAVSIACKYKGRLEHAVVLDPVRQEEFTASRGRGAALNGRRLSVSGRKILEGALLG
ncbi:type III secretion system regulator SuhB, partial [Pseudomonas aeruginosa]